MEIEDIVKRHVDSGTSSAISAGLVDENGSRFLNYGEIKKESGIAPINRTVYEIGSITKTFTAVLTTRLAQKGTISMEDPVVNFLPELENSDFDKKKNKPVSPTDTYIRNLRVFGGVVCVANVLIVDCRKVASQRIQL